MTKTIGIVGGGQLGRLMVEPAHRLGFAVTILDPTPNSPAGQTADKQIVGDFKDAEKIKELAAEVDFLTFEIELADAETLAVLAESDIPVNPTGETLKTIKNKYEQKVFFKEHGLPLGDFAFIPDLEIAQKIGEEYGYPLMLKACMDSYDGRGNYLVKTEDDLLAGLARFAGRKRYAEKFVPFVKELAVMAARDTNGNIYTYDTVETVHKNNICHTVSAPADISEEINQKAQKIAQSITSLFSGTGAFGIEMFLTEDGNVLINEVAPRVHNSGHHTAEACVTSQFENHIRAITGMEIGDTSMRVPASVMINILGDRSGEADPQSVAEANAIDGVTVHLYGKHEVRPERKMGHINAVANTREEALEKAEQARALITI